jgi:hypothetical protein
MRTILFVVAFAAASLAIGSLPRHSQVTCRTVVRFGRGGRWQTAEGARFAWLMEHS